MHRIIAAILAASACASALQAQTGQTATAAPVLTLAEALDRASASSPFQDVAAAGISTAEAQRRVAGLGPNPSIVGEAENVAGTGIYRGLRSSETTLGLALPLELGGKRGARIAPVLPSEPPSRRGIGVVLAGPDWMSLETAGRACVTFRRLTAAWSIWR